MTEEMVPKHMKDRGSDKLVWESLDRRLKLSWNIGIFEDLEPARLISSTGQGEESWPPLIVGHVRSYK